MPVSDKRRRWSLKEQAILLRQLADLLQKGYTLRRALEFVQLHMPAAKQEQLREAVLQLKTGQSLHDVFCGLQFHAEMLSYLFFAERHGDIVQALRQSSVLLERKQRRADKLKSALRYPLFLLTFFLGLVFLFNTVLLPQFSSLYTSVQAASGSVSIPLLILQALPKLCLILLAIVVLGFVYFRLSFRRLPAEEQMKRLLRIPVARSCLRSLHSHSFSIQLSSLLQGGLSVLDALILMGQQQHQPFLQHEAAAIKHALAGGEGLEQQLQKRPYYEKELVYVVAHGQANGALAEELADYAEMALERLEAFIAAATAAIQPLCFLVIGLLVVLLYMAIMLPMFNMMQTI